MIKRDYRLESIKGSIKHEKSGEEGFFGFLVIKKSKVGQQQIRCGREGACSRCDFA